MSKFLQGEPSDSFSWLETNGINYSNGIVVESPSLLKRVVWFSTIALVGWGSYSLLTKMR